jgi:hypothetical protein
MLYHIDSRILAVLLFAGIILCYFMGLKALQYKQKSNPSHEPSGIGAFESAMLGLISLLLAFTFNMSASHYDTRRQVLLNEINDIGTVILRCDLYPDSVRSQLRNDLKSYIAERIHYYEAGTDEKEIKVALDRANVISGRMWSLIATVSRQEGSATKSMQMIPAVNAMMDAVSTREEARKAHVPESIHWLLFALCLTGSFIVGYASRSRKADWIILLSYSLLTVLTVYLILDLDQPRYGFININSTHQNMYDLMNAFK